MARPSVRLRLPILFTAFPHERESKLPPPLFGVFLFPSSLFVHEMSEKEKGCSKGFFPFSVTDNLRIAIFAFFVFFLHSSHPLPPARLHTVPNFKPAT